MSQADADEQTADEHDDETCACGACQRTRERDASRVRTREAAVRGGLFPRAAELFGEHWIDGFTRGAPVEVSQLAQHALGNIFEELEKLGESTRRKLVGERYAATLPEGVRKSDVATALNYAESLIEFGRAQLGYLPETPYALNSQVRIGDEAPNASTLLGTYVGVSRAGLARVRVEGEDGGGLYEVPFSSVRPVAV